MNKYSRTKGLIIMQYEPNQLLDAVKEYIALMKESGLDFLSVKNDKFEIELGEKKPPIPTMPPQQGFAPQTASAAPANAAVSGNIVKSPIIGTFYSSAAPGKPAYKKLGDNVVKGEVICIVESMKLMNEITSDFSGRVAEIYVSDGEALEYDQPIMRIE